MIYLLALLVAASRLLPHPPNFVCLGALGLFAGYYLTGKRAYLVPVAVIFVSDLASHLMGIPGMGFYNPVVMIATYVGVSLAVPVGRRLSRGKLWSRLPLAAVTTSTLFFLISNFGVWLGPWYPASLAGLISCYINAIPFYAYTLAGDVVFAVTLFGVYEWSQSRVTFRRLAYAKA